MDLHHLIDFINFLYLERFRDQFKKKEREREERERKELRNVAEPHRADTVMLLVHWEDFFIHMPEFFEFSVLG